MENASQQANIVMGFLTVMMAMMKNTIVLGVKILVCTNVHRMEYVLISLHYVMELLIVNMVLMKNLIAQDVKMRECSNVHQMEFVFLSLHYVME